jgi:FtsP/CotA-like multicopper oxidase with cupredoxin domain
MNVKPKIYRFRMLNACISRSYRFRLSNGAPMHMVATDGGIMPVTQTVSEYRHAGAERYEFLVDFRPYAGKTIDLLNLSNPNNVNYDNTGKVMRFVVAASEQDLPADRPGSRTRTDIPTNLVPSEAMSLRPEQATNRTTLRFERTNGHFTINGKTWLDIENSNFQTVMSNPKPDEVGLWTLENRSGGWFHPVHIHLVDFQIYKRNGATPFAWEKGPKDVVYIGENETVQLLMKFTLNKGGGTTANGNVGGRYMMHCHNLPHEDHDMMSQFAVGNPANNDPITSAPPQPDTGQYDDGSPA